MEPSFSIEPMLLYTAPTQLSIFTDLSLAGVSQAPLRLTRAGWPL